MPGSEFWLIVACSGFAMAGAAFIFVEWLTRPKGPKQWGEQMLKEYNQARRRQERCVTTNTKIKWHQVDLDGPSITFFPCGTTSYHPKDIENKYCAHCHNYVDKTSRGTK